MPPQNFFFPFSLPAGVRLVLCDHAGMAGQKLALRGAEEARIARLKRAEHQGDLRRSLQVRRQAVAEITGAEGDAVAFAWTAEGAPALREPPGWCLSVSAVEGHTAVALAPAGTAIGVDISAIRAIGWRPMLEMVSAPGEAAAFLDAFSKDPAAALAAFHRLWTIKEAVLKATGRGMRAGARNVPVIMDWVASPAAAFGLTAFGQRYSGVLGAAGDLAICVAASAGQR